MSDDAAPFPADRRGFIGGSDARIIIGDDEPTLLRLWREKRGEVEAEDLSANLIVQLGVVTEPLNRHWFERNTGQVLIDVQRRVRHPVVRWMAATLDGMVEASGAVFEAKFMLPWSFTEEGAAEKYMPQLQHNMWITNAKLSALSIITGGGKWVEIRISADPLYQHLLLTAERKFWRCSSGEWVSSDCLGFPPAIQATGRLTFAPAGLIPAEHTSLRWTHKRSQLSGLALNDILQADRGQPSQCAQRHRSKY
jgi:predicted phage-related endonuclease